MRELILLIAISLCSLPVHAADEYRFGVWGTFTLTPEGTVADLEYEPRPPSSLERFVEEAMSAWRFEPVVEDGQAVSIRVRFGFDLIGTPDGSDIIVNVGEVNYSEVLPLTVERNQPASYPLRAMRRGYQATVVAEFRAGPDGRVTDVHISSIGVVDAQRLSARDRRQAIRDFSAATRRALLGWKVSPPPDGESGTGRFTFQFRRAEQWETGDGNHTWYDMEPAPWRLEGGERMANNAPADGGEYDLGDSRIRRLPDVAPGS